MITCKECKFWRKRIVYENVFVKKPTEHTNGYHKKVNMTKKREFESGVCKSKKFIIGFDDDMENSDELVYCDGEEYSVSLSTGENFGCIHGVKKELINGL